MFNSEAEMSRQFERFIKKNYGNAYLKECNGLFGIPDFVLYHKQKENTSIISFELKLKNWKQATIQAFRYKSFSNLSYVVLPDSGINPALNRIDDFKKYNIGLASFSEQDGLKLLYRPRLDKPYSSHLTEKMFEMIQGCRKKSKCISHLYH